MALQFILPLAHELVVDLFAGGGGASTGIEQAIGRHVDIAINHDQDAVALHAMNHPQTRHYVSDVFDVDPHEATGNQPVGLLHASPDCTHHSQARGGQPRSRAVRSLSWVVHRWAGTVRPRVITLENVEQILQWSPLVAKRCAATGRVVRLMGDEFMNRLYKPNRVAGLREEQGALNDSYGRRCVFPKGVHQADGTIVDIAAPMAFRVGLGSMQVLKLGKKTAGRMLDGREHNEFSRQGGTS